MKKILIFSTAYFPLIGGAEVAVKEITDRIADLEFDLITTRLDAKLPRQEKIGRVNVYRIGWGWKKLDKYWLAFGGWIQAGKLHRQNKYSAVWSIMASYGGFGALFFKKRNPEVPFLLTLQEGDDPAFIRRRVGFMIKYFRQIFERADYIQCISRFLADWARENGAKCPVEVVPNGVDLGQLRITNYELRIQETKERLKIKEGEKVVVTTSRLVKKNGVGDLIEAMRFLPENVKLVVVGDGELRGNYELKITNCKLNDRVIMVGAVLPEAVAEYLAVADVFCRPSLSEGLGNSFLEAMAMEVPVAATPVGGIPDFLVDGENGLFCQAEKPESIAEKIGRLLADEELRRRVIASGRRTVEERYDWDKIAARMKEIFFSL